MKLYLAGPDVFLPNAVEIGARKQAICAKYGFDGLYPVDPDVEEASADPEAIFRANCAHMQRADAGVFNLTPFRGPSADAGTLFELGFMFALGKPVYGYASRAGAYASRVRTHCGKLARSGGRLWDPSGHAVEDFGLHENLMIVRALSSFGRELVVVQERGARALAAMRAFEKCVAGLKTRRTRD
jgi:nucleoside 2-deoxyribosyltransferase